VYDVTLKNYQGLTFVLIVSKKPSLYQQIFQQKHTSAIFRAGRTNFIGIMRGNAVIQIQKTLWNRINAARVKGMAS